MADGADLSVVLITRNGAARIRGRLESAQWADEVVVVDQHSTDGTAASRRDCGAPVSSRRMTLGFGERKSFGLAPATRPCRGVRVTRISALRVFVAKLLLVFLRKYVWQRGLLEGTHGIIRCAMAGFGGFVNYVRFWELTGDRAG